MSAAAMFPGQGAQLVGMGRDVADAWSAAREVFARADAVLGLPLSQLCFEGPAERLEATDVQQPAIFTTSVALYRAALQAGRVDEGQFVAFGGLSLGEYTALHLAGALDFEDALRLVQRRGQLMQAAAVQSAGGMVAVMGLDEERALAVCERVAPQGRLSPANFNCPGQIVLSGDRAACEAAPPHVEALGGKAVMLKVSGAFHCALMQPAADQFRTALAEAGVRAPTVRVVANVDAGYHGAPDAIRDSLVRQIVSPVRWQECVQRLMADGCDEFWEIGPNRVLLGFMRKIDRKTRAYNLSSAADLVPPVAGAPA